MPEETQPEGNPGGGGNDSSSQKPSTSGGQPSSDFATKQEVAELRALYKGIQKSNDTVNARVEKRVNEALSTAKIGRVAELAKANMTPEQIEQQLVLDDLVAERKSQPSEVTSSDTGKNTVGSAEVQVQEVVQELGLDVNDKDVAAAVASGKILEVVKVAKSKLAAPSASAEDAELLTHRERPEDEKNLVLKTNDSSVLYKMASKDLRFKKKGA